MHVGLVIIADSDEMFTVHVKYNGSDIYVNPTAERSESFTELFDLFTEVTGIKCALSFAHFITTSDSSLDGKGIPRDTKWYYTILDKSYISQVENYSSDKVANICIDSPNCNLYHPCHAAIANLALAHY